MARKIAAIAGGVVLGLIIAFARAGAFPFWSSGDKDSSKSGSSAPQAVASMSAVESAPLQTPPQTSESAGRAGAIGSFAPLVKRVMPTVVNVAVVQDVKSSGFGGPGDEGGGGDEGPGAGPPQMPPGMGNGNGDPFEQFR